MFSKSLPGVFGVLAVILSALLPLPTRAAEDPTIATFPVVFAVTQNEGDPVREDAWLDEQLAFAESLFAPHGVHFKKASRRLVGILRVAFGL